MGVATSQQITKYYDLYRDIEVMFTKELIRATNLDPRQVYIKCAGSQWPCILNSASFLGAKIIIGTKSGGYAQIAKDNPTVSLRFYFQHPDTQALSFFITAKTGAIAPYGSSQELAIVSLNFTQRPPDDLIEILGALLEANVNSTKRREERIIITPESLRKLGIEKKETVFFVQNVPRRCILRDLSFSGAKLILVGLAPFLLNKAGLLRIEFDDPREMVNIKGVISGTEEIEGRKDLIAASVFFDEKTIPLPYKMHINTYLTQVRKTQLTRTSVAKSDGNAITAQSETIRSQTSPPSQPTEYTPVDAQTPNVDFN